MDKLEAHASALCKEGCAAEALPLDVTSAESIDTLCSRAGDVDVLINVSGTNIRKRFEAYTVEEYDRMMNTNVHGFVFLTQKIGGRMVERGKGGKIIFIGSLMSLLGMPYLTIYAMTKAALAGLTRTLAAEWGQYGIRCNVVMPGLVATPKVLALPEPVRSAMSATLPLGRIGEPAELAATVAFLLSPAAAYITGAVIRVDGGYGLNTSSLGRS
jgi:NAD(P)-dependent dehydrogenase (short-subunit alcohol dehydrogenase family)